MFSKVDDLSRLQTLAESSQQLRDCAVLKMSWLGLIHFNPAHGVVVSNAACDRFLHVLLAAVLFFQTGSEHLNGPLVLLPAVTGSVKRCVVSLCLQGVRMRTFVCALQHTSHL